MSMSTVKFRIGVRTSKGVVKDYNADRILIGMDPASNDWLFSPDETKLGEFGTLIVLADGFGDDEYEGECAHYFTQNIKNLFDQTLELPHHEHDMFALLKQYITKAHQHLLHHYKLFKPDVGCSFVLALVRLDQLFLCWTGNVRAYRYRPGGVKGSIFTQHRNFELLTVDHSLSSARALFNYPKTRAQQEDAILAGIGHSEIPMHISTRLLNVYQQDRYVLLSEGIHKILDENQISLHCAQEEIPQHCSSAIVSDALAQATPYNCSAVVIDITQGKEPPMISRATDEYLRQDAIRFFGLPEPTFSNSLTLSVKKKLMAFNKSANADTKEVADEVLPMGTRTVFPEQLHGETSVDETKGGTEFSEKRMPPSEVVSSPLEEKPKPNPEDISLSSGHIINPKARIQNTVFPEPDYPLQDKTWSSKEDSLTEDLAESFGQDISAQMEQSEPIEASEDKHALSQQSEESDESDPTLLWTEELVSLEFDIPEKTTQAHKSDPSEIDPNQEISSIKAFEENRSLEEQSPPQDNDFFDFPDSPATTEGQTSLPLDDQLSDTTIELDETQIESLETDTAKAQTRESSESDRDSLSIRTFVKILKKPSLIIILGALLLILIIYPWACPSSESGQNDLIPQQQNTETIQLPTPEVQKKQGNPKKEDLTQAVPPQSNQRIPPDNTPKNTKESPQKNQTKEVEKPGKKAKQTEPDYDPQLQQNKHQLIDEINALWSMKKDLCKKVANYHHNAPIKKQEKLQALKYDCEQLEQKFNSIYDPKTGYFKTVRYDFLMSTINNIKFSLGMVDGKLEEIRQE